MTSARSGPMPAGWLARPPATMEPMAPTDDYRKLSFWHDTVPGTLAPGNPLPGDIEADVAIVGAGFTGLWTAYYLSQADPALRIVICERQIAGFGASGRNGGWCSALFPASLSKLERMAGRAAALSQHRAVQDTLGQVAPGGATEASRLAGATDVRGGTFTPHCAAIHPARLARGLTASVRSRGISLFERTPVSEIQPGRLLTARGMVTAKYVVRATEGYTPALPGLHRTVAPVYSLMIATAPLPDAVWQEIGLADRPTFGDLRHLIIYGQRTADGRLG